MDANTEKLKNALLELFMSEVKGATSCADRHELYNTFKQYGYTGMFTGLDRYFDNQYDLLQTIEDLW